METLEKEKIMAALDRLPKDDLPRVFEFLQFLRYRRERFPEDKPWGYFETTDEFLAAFPDAEEALYDAENGENLSNWSSAEEMFRSLGNDAEA